MKVLNRSAAEIARIAADLTKIERSVDAAVAAVGSLDIVAGKVTVITGAPGAGKSSLIRSLLDRFHARGEKVAAILIDPSSPVTGGSVLGDRVRILGAEESGVFIRSVAARNGSEAVGTVAPIMAWTLLNAGFDHVLIESVGIGQQELDVAKRGDVLALVLGPDSGDWVQFIKSGVLDLCNLIVVTKCDVARRPVVVEIRKSVHLQSFRSEPLPVCPVSSLSGEGIAELVTSIDAQHQMLDEKKVALRQAILRDILIRLITEKARLEFQRKLDRCVAGDSQGQVAEAMRFIETVGGHDLDSAD